MKKIIFFRSEIKFIVPGHEEFAFLNDEVEIHQIDVDDSYEPIVLNFDLIEKKLNQILSYVQYDVEIFLCGAVPLGFVWLLRGFLDREFPGVCFRWLQMERKKDKDIEKKFYRIWDDF